LIPSLTIKRNKHLWSNQWLLARYRHNENWNYI